MMTALSEQTKCGLFPACLGCSCLGDISSASTSPASLFSYKNLKIQSRLVPFSVITPQHSTEQNQAAFNTNPSLARRNSRYCPSSVRGCRCKLHQVRSGQVNFVYYRTPRSESSLPLFRPRPRLSVSRRTSTSTSTSPPWGCRCRCRGVAFTFERVVSKSTQAFTRTVRPWPSKTIATLHISRRQRMPRILRCHIHRPRTSPTTNRILHLASRLPTAISLFHPSLP